MTTNIFIILFGVSACVFIAIIKELITINRILNIITKQVKENTAILLYISDKMKLTDKDIQKAFDKFDNLIENDEYE